MSFIQIELVWVRVRVEWECFWVNLREDNKVSEYKMAVWIQHWKNSRWLPSSRWVRMNEWSFLCANGGKHSWQIWVSLRGKTKMAESKMAESNMAEFMMTEFKMAAIIKLNENEWVKFFCANGGNQSWQVWVSLRGNTKMAESKMA